MLAALVPCFRHLLRHVCSRNAQTSTSRNECIHYSQTLVQDTCALCGVCKDGLSHLPALMRADAHVRIAAQEPGPGAECQVLLYGDAARAAVGVDIADWQDMPCEDRRQERLSARKGLPFKALVFLRPPLQAGDAPQPAEPGTSRACWACSTLTMTR